MTKTTPVTLLSRAATSLCLLLLLALQLQPPSHTLTHAWGYDGHTFVGEIAQAHLNKCAKRHVAEILGGGLELGDVSTWADHVKENVPEYKYTSKWHYLNMRHTNTGDAAKDACPGLDIQKDCFEQNAAGPGVCLPMAIRNMTTTLLSLKVSDYTDEKTTNELGGANVTLKFLTHLTGDASQPLHWGFANDRGGNFIRGKFFGEEWVDVPWSEDRYGINLHAMWDFIMIEKRMRDDFSNDHALYLKYLLDTARDMPHKYNMSNPNFNIGRAKEWGELGTQLVCQQVLVASDSHVMKSANPVWAPPGTFPATDFDLGRFYYTRAMPIVEQQVILGGLRLAGLLNHVWPETQRCLGTLPEPASEAVKIMGILAGVIGGLGLCAVVAIAVRNHRMGLYAEELRKHRSRAAKKHDVNLDGGNQGLV